MSPYNLNYLNELKIKINGHMYIDTHNDVYKNIEKIINRRAPLGFYGTPYNERIFESELMEINGDLDVFLELYCDLMDSIESNDLNDFRDKVDRYHKFYIRNTYVCKNEYSFGQKYNVSNNMIHKLLYRLITSINKIEFILKESVNTNGTFDMLEYDDTTIGNAAIISIQLELICRTIGNKLKAFLNSIHLKEEL